MEENSLQGIWDHIEEEMLLEFAESGCPIFRATTPLSRGQLRSKEHGKLSIHYAADQETIETIFRIIVSANQLSLYGALANMSEEFETHQDRSGTWCTDGTVNCPQWNQGRSSFGKWHPVTPESSIATIWRTNRIAFTRKNVSKILTDAGFTHVVEIGQYFMTQDTEEQFFSRACREYTLPRNDESSQPKGWIQGNTRIGPALEERPVIFGKNGVEIRIWSLSEDNTQSWVRIYHGSNKFVIDSNYNTEVPADLTEEQVSQSSVKVVAARSKAKAKLQEGNCWYAKYHTDEWTKEDWHWTRRCFSLRTKISKKVINLRHSQTVQREDDGAVQFWRLQNNLWNQFPQVQYWSDDRWKLFGSRRSKKGISVLHWYLFQKQLFISELFKMFVLNLHSIINGGLIPGGQKLSKRQTVFFLPIDPLDKGHQDPEKIDFSVPRRAQYLYTVHGRNIKTRYFGLMLIFRFEKDCHSIRLDRMQSSFKEHFKLIVFQKLWDWRLEKFCMKNHTCLLDHHRRSHSDTITIGPEGKFHWFLQLINSQKAMLFDSHEEKFNT